MRVALDFNNKKPGELVIKFKYIIQQMKANAAVFPKPPEDLDVFLAKVEDFENSITAAADGSKKAISLRNRLQYEAIRTATFIGHYVEAIAEDAATVYLSGFEPAYKYARLPQPLPKTRISKVVRGPNSGTAVAYIVPYSRSVHGKVGHYELRYAPKNGESIGAFVTKPSATARFGVPVTDLTPTTTYIFQARALNTKCFSDWSDPVTYIAT